MGVTKTKADVEILVTVYCGECGLERMFDYEDVGRAVELKESHEFECPELDHFYRHAHRR